MKDYRARKGERIHKSWIDGLLNPPDPQDQLCLGGVSVMPYVVAMRLWRVFPRTGLWPWTSCIFPNPLRVASSHMGDNPRPSFTFPSPTERILRGGGAPWR